MTRFARAKGSKSSNEKKPEEATSWSEMKKAMLLKSKPAKEPENVPTKQKAKEVPSDQTEWGSLGDETSLLKQNTKKGKKESVKLTSEGKSDFEENKKVKMTKKKNSKEIVSAGGEIVRNKKNKKRKINADNSETGPVKKKKKFENKASLENPKAKKIVKNKEKVNEVSAKVLKNFEKKVKPSSKFNKMRKGRQDDKRNSFPKNDKSSSFVVDELIVNGEKIPIVKFQGFNVTLEDAERLKKLRLDMIKEGIPKNKLEAAIKLERRRAEKALARLKKAVCFHCRGYGHLLSNCPNLTEKQNTSTGICYKCGSTEHSSIDCKVVRGTNYQFAECFICKEQGHIARQCPDNPKGLYPQGGACRECGDVTHLRKDCPQVVSKKVKETVTVGVRNDRDLECLDEEIANREKKNMKKQKKKNPTVVF